MKYTHKSNSGSAFKNREMLEEKDPMYKGTALVAGKSYWVSVWQNSTKAGDTYLALKFNEIVDAKPKIEQIQKSIDAPKDEWTDSDDIPF